MNSISRSLFKKSPILKPFFQDSKFFLSKTQKQLLSDQLLSGSIKKMKKIWMSRGIPSKNETFEHLSP